MQGAPTVLQFALAYAKLGWPVLPVAPRDKRPLHGQGIDHATTDAAKVREWFTLHPDAGIGIRLDAAGLCAVDIDPRNGGRLELADELPPTLTATTGGGGLHLVYRVPPGQEVASARWPGVDHKHRGYIVVEPSTHPSGKAYAWRDWDVCSGDAPGIADAPPQLLKPAATSSVPPAAAGDASVGQGSRNAYLSREAYRLRRDGASVDAIEQVLLALNSARCTPPLEEEEVRGIARRKARIAPERAAGQGAPAGSEPPAGIDSPAGSDDAYALRFVDRYGETFRWTPGMDWMTLPEGGDRWVRDDGLRRYDLARVIVREAAAELTKASDKKAAASSKTVNAVITLARSDPRIVLPAEAWDCDPMMLNTPQGMVNLRTGRMRDRTNLDHVTQCTRVSPARGDCPTWLRFLDDVFMGDRDLVEFIQRLLGYLLTADRREQKIFFMYGLGANGKSTLWDLFLWIAGSYALKLPSNVLMQSQFQGHPTELAQLAGKRIALSSEPEEGQYWAEARVKELTGDETLTARFMRGDFFTFPQTQKHLVVGNYKPRLKGSDHALARRFVLVPFLARFSGARRDPLMPGRLRQEAPAVLAWAVDGACKWSAEGLAIPASVAAASAEYMADNDDMALWMEERCVRHAGSKAAASALYKDYCEWLRGRGQQPPSLRLWGERLSSVEGVTKRKSHGVVMYSGVGLRTEEVLC